MASKHMKKSSTSLILRGCEATPRGSVIAHVSDWLIAKPKSKCWRMWRDWHPCRLAVGMQNGAATVGNGVEVPPKIKNTTTTGSSNSTAGYLSKRIVRKDGRFISAACPEKASRWRRSRESAGHPSERLRHRAYHLPQAQHFPGPKGGPVG